MSQWRYLAVDRKGGVIPNVFGEEVTFTVERSGKASASIRVA